jgi:co-chaperonin GroES (HSP10)
MRTQITALKDNVIVSIEAAKEKERGGILLPETTKGFDGQAVVCFVGPEVTGIFVKEKVAIPNSHGASSLRIGETQYLVFKQDQIIAKIAQVDDTVPARSTLPPG